MQEKIKLFDRLGIKVVAASTDAETGAAKMISEQNITFPVGFGVSQAEIDALVIWDAQSSDRLAQACRVLGYTLFETAYATSQLGRMSPREIAVFVKDRQG